MTETYGNLTVLGRIRSDYLVRCDCGTIRVYPINMLKRGNIKSCGCLRGRNRAIMESPIGNRYGNLTVLKRDAEGGCGYFRLICRCDCGNIISVKRKDLMKGTVTDCGECNKQKDELPKLTIEECEFVILSKLAENIGKWVETYDMRKTLNVRTIDYYQAVKNILNSYPNIEKQRFTRHFWLRLNEVNNE